MAGFGWGGGSGSEFGGSPRGAAPSLRPPRIGGTLRINNPAGPNASYSPWHAVPVHPTSVRPTGPLSAHPSSPPGATSSPANPGPPSASGPDTTSPGSGATPNPSFSGDAQYMDQLAKANADAQTKIDGLTRNISDAGTALQSGLATNTLNAQNAVTRLQDAENARGGFAQGALGQSIGQSNSAYAQRAANLTAKYQGDVGNWNAAIDAVRQGLPVEVVALQLAAAGRMAGQVARSGGTLGTPAPSSPAPAQATQTTASGSPAAPSGVATAPTRGEAAPIAPGAGRALGAWGNAAYSPWGLAPAPRGGRGRGGTLGARMTFNR